MTNNNQESSSLAYDDEVTIKDFILKVKEWYRYLFSKWVIISVFGLSGGILGFVYASYKKAVYTATTTFVLEDSEGGGSLGQYAGMAAMVGIDIGGGGGGVFQGDNIIELYKSRMMLKNALLSKGKFGNKKEQLLIDRYLEFNEMRKNWKRPELRSISFADTSHFTIVQDSLIGEIVKDINKNYLNVFKPDKKLNILKVEVKSIDEGFAKCFSDQIVSTVNNFYIETKTKKSIQNVSILQRQTDSVRAVMNGAIFASASSMDATPNINPARQILRAPVQRSQFNAEANKAILSELIKNLELSKMSLRRETPLIQVIDKPVFPLNKEKMGRLEGLIMGGFIAGLLVVLSLIINKLLKSALA